MKEIKYKAIETMATFGLGPEKILFNSISVEGNEEYCIFESDKGTRLKFIIKGNTYIEDDNGKAMTLILPSNFTTVGNSLVAL